MANHNSMKIESGIPLPAHHVVDGATYPFRALKAGESFAVPISLRQRCRQALSQHANRYGGKFATRTVVENNVKVMRVWCLEPTPSKASLSLTA